MSASSVNLPKLGSKIADARRAIGLSQADLADRIGVDRQTISKWERGLSEPSMGNSSALAQVLGEAGGDTLLQLLLTRELPLGQLAEFPLFASQGVGRRLFNAIQSAGITQSELARRSEISLSTVRRVLTSDTMSIMSSTIGRLSSALSVPEFWLLNGPGDDPPPMLGPKLYNLIVSGREGAWDSGQYEMDGSRIFEYTDRSLIAAIGDVSTDSLMRLTTYPTLFAYETAVNKPAKLGRIVDVSARGRNVEIQFRLDDPEVSINADEMIRYSMLLGIQPDELNRTHWSVKEIDLDQYLSDHRIDPREISPEGDRSLEQLPAPHRFVWDGGQFAAEPVSGTDLDALGKTLLQELKGKARRLLDRLLQTQARTYFSESVAALIDALGDSVDAGLLLSRSRAIDAIVAIMDTAESREEFAADVQAMFRDVAATLDDVRASIPEIAEIEASRLAMSMDASVANGALAAATEISRLAGASRVVDKSVTDALTQTDADIEVASKAAVSTDDVVAVQAAISARGKLVALRLLDVRNFVAKAISSAQAMSLDFGRDALRSSRKGALDGIEAASKEIVQGSAKAAVAYLVYSLAGPLGALAFLVSAFNPLAKKAEKVGRPEGEDSGPTLSA